MGYRFCFGASGSGKSTYLHRWILQCAADKMREPDSSGPRFIMIVPEQFSMQTQRELVLESAARGIMNVEVLSFGRLAYRIFPDTGQDSRAVLNEMGKSLLLRRAADRCSGKLRILGSTIRRSGMISEVKSVLSEFMQYGVTPDRITEMQEHAASCGQGALAARLHDLRVLQDAFAEEKEKRFVTKEEKLDLLAEAIPGSRFIRNSVIVIDGFTGFTPVQLRVVAAIIRTAADVIICLDLGKDGGPGPGWVESNLSAGKEQALFYLSRKTVRDLRQIALEEGLERGEDIYVGSSGDVSARFLGNPVLAHMERRLFRYPLVPYPGKTGGEIRLLETANPEEEARQICIAIRRLVTEEGYRYRDIAVVTGDLSSYGELLERRGAQYGIPVYIDRTSPVILNPLTEAVRSALEIPASGYSYEAVFRFLRSGMSGLTQDEVDILEEFCISHGIRGKKKWLLPFDADCEPLRRKLLEELEPLLGTEQEIEKRAPVKTAAQRTEALYDFMVRCGMEEKMAQLTESFREENDAVRQKQYSQLYRAVIGLLEQIHLLLGDEKISAEDYREILDAGLEEIRLGTLPQQADRLLVGDIQRTRLPQVRILFFAGVNDGIIPKGAAAGGLLSDIDREFLLDAGVELSPAPRQQMYLQRLYLYLNMTKPTDRLILSYSLKTAEGKSLRPSYLVRMTEEMFPDIRREDPAGLPADRQLMGVQDSLSYLAPKLRRFADGLILPGTGEERSLLTVYGFLFREGGGSAALRDLRNAAFLRYDPGKISRRSAADLYGKYLTGSISRMETAAQCSLRHFLKYGLRLKEREIFEYRPVDAGTILHRSLELFDKKLAREGKSWRDFSREDGMRIADSSLSDTAARYHDLLLYDTARSTYQLERLRRILRRTVDSLQYQILRGKFDPAESEFSFGERGQEGGIFFPLDKGAELRLTGRIDRLDLAEEDGTLFVKILDYKSGFHDLVPEKVASGLQLQLIIYMNAAMEVLRARFPGQEIVPAAMFYYRMTDTVLKDLLSDRTMLESDPDEDSLNELNRKVREELRPTGLFNSDPRAVSLLDTEMTGKSEVIPARFNSGGGLASSSKVFTEEEFEQMSESAREAVCRLAQEILNGAAAAFPVREDSKTKACTYCPYREVCSFDPRIPGYRYKDI